MARGERLGPEEVAARLQDLMGWEVVGDRLRKEFEFASFAAAFSFMTQVALAAESMDHHPDWSNSYRRVTIELSSHDVGGISARDFRLATAIEAASKQYPHEAA
jgi:4a-hydroxytetrahydrobiopterin dehydratase